MRILYVTCYYKPAYVYGGPARSVPLMCEGLAEAGAEVRVVTTNANGRNRLEIPPDRFISVDGVEVCYCPVAVGGTFFFSPVLAKRVSEQTPWADVVVAETLWEFPNFSVHRACKQAGKAYVIALRAQLLPRSLKQKSWKKRPYLAIWGRRYLDAAAALHCTDESEAQAAARLGLTAPCFIVPNGVELAQPAARKISLRSSLGIPEAALVLIIAGRIHPMKQPDIAIKTLAAVREQGFDAHLVIAGPDEMHMRRGLEEFADVLGLGARVHFTGLLVDADAGAALADCDLLLMPSKPGSENFGMAALEALAAGTPVLTSDGTPVGRWAELVGAGRVAPADEHSFGTAAVEMLAHGRAHLGKMGARGIELANRRFSKAGVAQAMLAQLAAIAATGRPLTGEAADRCV